MPRSLGTLVTAALLALTSTVALAAVSEPDAGFMAKAAAGGIAEVQLGQLAEKKAHDPEVKAFARRMVADHGKANKELMGLAAKLGVVLPKDTDAKHKAVAAQLAKLSGEAFDQAYMAQQVKDHEETVALFRRETQNGKVPAVKQWAAKTLPTLTAHHHMAVSEHKGEGHEGHGHD